MSRIKTSSSTSSSSNLNRERSSESSRRSNSDSTSKKTKDSSRSRSKQKKSGDSSNSNNNSGGRVLTQRSTSSGSKEEQKYSAKRSGRVSAKKYVADGDTWYENIAVVEIPVSALEGHNGNKSKRGDKKKKSSNNSSSNSKGKDKEFELIIRSYFQSELTGHRVWDEPPSGASNIQFASEDTKRMAELQVRDLQVTTEIVAVQNDKKDKHKSSSSPNSNTSNTTTKNDKNNHQSNSKKGRLSKLKGIIAGSKSSNNNNNVPKDVNLTERRRITYKKGSVTSKGYFEDERDLEAAIKESVQNKNHRDTVKSSTSLEEQEAIAVARALSLSEKEDKPKQQHQQQQHPIRRRSNEDKNTSYSPASSRQSSKQSLSSSNHDDDDSMTEEEKRILELTLQESEREANQQKFASSRQADEVQNTARLYDDVDEDDRKMSRLPGRNETRRSPLDSVASTRSLPRNDSSFYAYGTASMPTTNEGEEYDYYTVDNSTLETQSYTRNHPSSSYDHYRGKSSYDDAHSDEYTTGQYTYGVSELTANTASTREPYRHDQHRR